MPTISFRVSQEEYLAYKEVASCKGLTTSQLFREHLKKTIDESSSQQKLIYPTDPGASRLYSVLLRETGILDDKDSRPIIPHAKLKNLRYKANIKTFKAMENNLKILEAQGFVVKRDKGFIIIQKWNGK